METSVSETNTVQSKTIIGRARMMELLQEVLKNEDYGQGVSLPEILKCVSVQNNVKPKAILPRLRDTIKKAEEQNLIMNLGDMRYRLMDDIKIYCGTCGGKKRGKKRRRKSGKCRRKRRRRSCSKRKRRKRKSCKRKRRRRCSRRRRRSRRRRKSCRRRRKSCRRKKRRRSSKRRCGRRRMSISTSSKRRFGRRRLSISTSSKRRCGRRRISISTRSKRFRKKLPKKVTISKIRSRSGSRVSNTTVLSAKPSETRLSADNVTVQFTFRINTNQN